MKRFCSYALIAATALGIALSACSERERIGGVVDSSEIGAGRVFGLIRLAGDQTPIPGVLVRTVIARTSCSGAVMARGPESSTNSTGFYDLRVLLAQSPFTGCVRLEVDFDRDTIRPDTVVLGPVIRFEGNWSVRLDVAILESRP